MAPPTPASSPEEAARIAERKEKEDRKREAERKKQEEELKKKLEEERKKEEKARKKEAEEAERARKAARRGGIGGQRAETPSPAPVETPVTTSPADSSSTTATAPPATAPPPTVGSGPPRTPQEEKALQEQEKKAREEAKRRDEENRKRRKAEEEAAKKKQPPTPGPSLRELLFRELITIGDVRTNISFSERNSVSKVHGTVPLPFRLGLSEDFGALPRASNSTTSHTSSQTATANAAVTLLRDVAVDANFQWSDQQNDINRAVSNTRSVTWPSLRINLNSIEKKLKLGGLFNSFTASSNFERREEIAGTGSNKRERTTTTSAWRPFLQVEAGWKNGWRTSFSADRSTVVSESNTGGTVTAGVVTTRNSSAYRLGLAKSLGLKKGDARAGVRNSVDVKLDFTYNRDASISDYAGREDVASLNDNFQGRFSTSYRFTTTVSGSMQLTVGQRRDLEADTIDRSVGLQATAAVSF